MTKTKDRMWDMGPSETRFPGVVVEWLLHYWVWAPLNLTAHRSRPWRMLGLMVFLLWCLPAFVVAGLPILFFIFADSIAETWREVPHAED